MNAMRTVKEIMKPVLNIGPNQTVLEAANIMKESGYGSLLIVDGKITVGIVTVRDLVMRVIAKDLPHTTPISEVMSSPLITIDANVSLKKAARLMGERKIRRLPVCESGGVIGVLVAFDVLHQLTNKTLADEVWEALGVEH
jgi:signal-transduction protein with cAMP-binding, CBS, and nucleotidyltransferase domain